MDSFIQDLFAKRIGGKNYGKKQSSYKFVAIKAIKEKAQRENPHKRIIDMGIGEPDDMAFPQIVKSLQEEAQKHENRVYPDNDGPEFLAAATRYMKRVFGVEIDTHSEILHSIGIIAAQQILPTCFINPGDIALMTVPGYPVFGIHTTYYGGHVYELPLTPENHFLPHLKSIPAAILDRSKVLVLNYPNNPTGACATKAFFEEVVAWAIQHRIMVVHDAAYAAITFDRSPLSILSIPRAKEVAVELHSMSKGHNMTGWRLGWVCGNPLIVKAYGDVKNNTDSGQFLAIQKAAAHALDDETILPAIVEKYNRRLNKLSKTLQKLGFHASKPGGSFYLYTQAPRSATLNNRTTNFSTAESFSHWLIQEQLISTVPWDESGSPHIRFSVTFEVPHGSSEDDLIESLYNRLSPYYFIF